jgi:6-phosphogluconolactonase (cycloisomerase 2 family)
MYVLSRAVRDVMTFAVDEATGELTLLGRIPTRRVPSALALVQGALPITQTTRYAYVANAESDDASTFAVDELTGVLSEVGLPALTGDRPCSVAIDPRGRFAYVANEGDGTISAFSADALTGALFEIAPAVAVGDEPVALAIDRAGRFLYSVQRADHEIAVLRIEPNGTLFQLASLPLDYGLLEPVALGVDPTGLYLYVAAEGDGTPGTSGLAILAIDPRSGIPARATAPGAVIGVTGVAFHPAGGFLYALIEGTDEIAAFEINRVSGALTELLPRTIGGDAPAALALDPAGRFAYAAFADPLGTGYVTLFPIDAATGQLGTPAGPFVGGAEPTDMRVDAVGKFLHVVNADSNNVTSFRIDPQTGALAPPATALTGLSPSSIAVSNAVQ